MNVLDLFAITPIGAIVNILRIARERETAQRQYTVIGDAGVPMDETWTRHEADKTPSGQVEYTKPMKKAEDEC